MIRKVIIIFVILALLIAPFISPFSDASIFNNGNLELHDQNSLPEAEQSQSIWRNAEHLWSIANAAYSGTYNITAKDLVTNEIHYLEPQVLAQNANLSTCNSSYVQGQIVSIFGEYYTTLGNVTVNITYLSNNTVLPGFPKIVTADALGQIQTYWLIPTNQSIEMYNITAVDNTNISLNNYTNIYVGKGLIFKPGSLIIPMDNKQNTGAAANSWPSQISTYGLVYWLLVWGVNVDWIVAQGKTYLSTDFTALTNDGDPDSPGTEAVRAYGGAPFMIQDPNPTTKKNEAWDIIKDIRTSKGRYSDVKIHQLNETLAIRPKDSAFLDKAPKVAIRDGDEGKCGYIWDSTATPSAVMEYDLVTDQELRDGNLLTKSKINCSKRPLFDWYYIGHEDFTKWSANDAYFPELILFTNKTGHVHFECISSTLNSYTEWFTTDEKTVEELSDAWTNYNVNPAWADHPYAQSWGDLVIEGGAFQVWEHNHSWNSNVGFVGYVTDTDTTTLNTEYIKGGESDIADNIYGSSEWDYSYLFGTAGGGVVTQMGGHSQKNTPGQRLTLNSIFMAEISPRFDHEISTNEIPVGSNTSVKIYGLFDAGTMSYNTTITNTFTDIVWLEPGSVKIYVEGGSFEYYPTNNTLVLNLGTIDPRDFPNRRIYEFKLKVSPKAFGTIEVLNSTQDFGDNWGKYNVVAKNCLSVVAGKLLNLTKSSDKATIPTGEQSTVRLTIKVKNLHTAFSMANITINDTIISGTWANNVSVSAGTFERSGSLLWWNLSSLLPEGVETLSFDINITPVGAGFYILNNGAQGIGNISGKIQNETSNKIKVEAKDSPILDFYLAPTSVPDGTNLMYFNVTNIGTTAGTFIGSDTDHLRLGIPAEWGVPKDVTTAGAGSNWKYRWMGGLKRLEFYYDDGVLGDHTWTKGAQLSFGFNLTTIDTAGDYDFPASGSINNEVEWFNEILIVNVQKFAGVSITPEYSVSTGPNQLYYLSHNISNTGNGVDIFDITITNTVGWKISVYHDLNMNGTFDPTDPVMGIDNNGDGIWDWVNVTNYDPNANSKPDTRSLTNDWTFMIILEVEIPSLSQAVLNTVNISAISNYSLAVKDLTIDLITITVGGGPPILSNLDATPNPQENGLEVNITVDVWDDFGVSSVWVNIIYPDTSQINTTMNQGTGLRWYFEKSFDMLGVYTYSAGAKDTFNNLNALVPKTFTIIDTDGPFFDNQRSNPGLQKTGFSVLNSVDVWDDVNLTSVWIELIFPDTSVSNISMTKGLGDRWYYNQSYSMVGTYTWTVSANDSSNNWNSTGLGTFMITDKVGPFFANLTDTPDPQENGYKVKISVDVWDVIVVDTVWVKIIYPDTSEINVSMQEDSGTKYYFESAYHQLGTYTYAVCANNTLNTWKSINPGTFEIIDTDGPFFDNLTATPDPQENSFTVSISVDLWDDIGVNKVWIIIKYPDNSEINISMDNSVGTKWYLDKIYNLIGDYNYRIWANDLSGNLNGSEPGSFIIRDTDGPFFGKLSHNPAIQENGYKVKITVEAWDDVELDTVWVNMIYPGGSDDNIDMVKGIGNEWNLDIPYELVGKHTYMVWARDSSNNLNSIGPGTFEIVDTDGPFFEKPVAKPDPQENGYPIEISANVWDDIGLDRVWLVIKYPDGSDKGFDMFQESTRGLEDKWYIDMAFDKLGDYSYQIWATDILNNMNSTSPKTFEIVDTDGPFFDKLAASPETQENDENIEISVDVWDDIAVDTAWVVIEAPDGNEINVSLEKSEDNNWNKILAFNLPGIYSYTVWGLDVPNNLNYTGPGIFTIIDTDGPFINHVTDTPDPQNSGGYINITADIFDDVEVETAWVVIEDSNGNIVNMSMSKSSDNIWFFNDKYIGEGEYIYTIWAKDTSDNIKKLGPETFVVKEPDPNKPGIEENLMCVIWIILIVLILLPFLLLFRRKKIVIDFESLMDLDQRDDVDRFKRLVITNTTEEKIVFEKLENIKPISIGAKDQAEIDEQLKLGLSLDEAKLVVFAKKNKLLLMSSKLLPKASSVGLIIGEPATYSGYNNKIVADFDALLKMKANDRYMKFPAIYTTNDTIEKITKYTDIHNIKVVELIEDDSERLPKLTGKYKSGQNTLETLSMALTNGNKYAILHKIHKLDSEELEISNIKLIFIKCIHCTSSLTKIEQTCPRCHHELLPDETAILETPGPYTTSGPSVQPTIPSIPEKPYEQAKVAVQSAKPAAQPAKPVVELVKPTAESVKPTAKPVKPTAHIEKPCTPARPSPGRYSTSGPTSQPIVPSIQESPYKQAKLALPVKSISTEVNGKPTTVSKPVIASKPAVTKTTGIVSTKIALAKLVFPPKPTAPKTAELVDQNN